MYENANVADFGKQAAAPLLGLRKEVGWYYERYCAGDEV